MLISSPNKFLKIISLSLLAIGLWVPAHARPIANISVGFTPAHVGSATVIVAGQISTATTIIVSAAGSGTDVDDTNVTLELLEGGAPLSGALIPITVTISSGNSGPYRPNLTFLKAGTYAIRASSGSVFFTSQNFTVVPGPESQLVVLADGETLAPLTGKSGTPKTQLVSQAFDVSVYACDSNFNIVTSTNATEAVTISTQPNLTVNSANPHNLSAGFTTFNIQIDAPKVTRTITASATGLTHGTADVNTAGPPAQEIFPFPSPFNPHLSPIKFQYSLDTANAVKVLILDQFGQQVWEISDSGQANKLNVVQWDGRTKMGDYAAVGVYYAVLEVGGSVKSKKKFGVIK